MSELNPQAFTAQILEVSASAYAGFAAGLLLERHPDLGERYAPAALGVWRDHLTQRVLELAAAVGAEEPRIFVSRVLWAEKSFRARDMNAGDVGSGLRCLREILDEELPSNARDTAVRYLEEAITCLGSPPAAERQGLDPAAPMGRLALRYLQAILDGDGRAAVDLMVDAVDGGLSVRDAYLDVLVPALREAGDMWHGGEVNVAEEHFVTATTERAMSILTHGAPRPEPNGKTVVSAAVTGNTHGLAARIAADFLELAGWRSISLGSDVPTDDVASAAVYFKADLVVLATALSTQIKTTQQAIDALRGLSERQVRVVVGGSAFIDAPDLWQRLGADGYAATAEGVVPLADELVPSPR